MADNDSRLSVLLHYLPQDQTFHLAQEAAKKKNKLEVRMSVAKTSPARLPRLKLQNKKAGTWQQSNSWAFFLLHMSTKKDTKPSVAISGNTAHVIRWHLTTSCSLCVNDSNLWNYGRYHSITGVWPSSTYQPLQLLLPYKCQDSFLFCFVAWWLSVSKSGRATIAFGSFLLPSRSSEDDGTSYLYSLHSSSKAQGGKGTRRDQEHNEWQ